MTPDAMLWRVLVYAALLACSSWNACAVGIFSNSNSITILDSMNPPTKASPYPCTINVSGFSNMVISKVTVTLTGFSHTFPSDACILLVGPQGHAAVLMAEVGGQSKFSVTNLTITLDDDATNSLPVYTNLTSGTFKPFNAFPVLGIPGLPFNFPPPAPSPTSNTPSILSVFKNTDPNGTWSLYIVDNVSGDAGVISGGWSLNVSAGYALQMTFSGPNVVLSWPTNAAGFQLQSGANPSDPNSWRDIITPPAIISNRYVVTNPILYRFDYYRLKH